MQTIGERLEEARNRLGVSLRDASEATKIRADYLQLMESGSFSFNLPEVYKRGFLKIYARYLKLDAEKTANDFNALIMASSRTSRREVREHLGRVEIPGRESAASGDDGASATQPASAFGGDDGIDRGSLIKLAVGFVLAIALLVVIFLGLQRLMSRGAGTDTASAATSQNATVTPPRSPPPPKANPPPAPAIKLTFTARDDISNLTVRQVSDRAVLYNKPLAKGQSTTVTSAGRAEISVTNAQFLVIEQNGQAFLPGDDSGKPLTGTQFFVWPPGAAPAK